LRKFSSGKIFFIYKNFSEPAAWARGLTENQENQEKTVKSRCQNFREKPRKPKRLYKKLDSYYESLRGSAVKTPDKFAKLLKKSKINLD